MIEKVKLPKEVAEGLDFFVSKNASKYSAFTAILAVGECGKYAGKIFHYFQDMDALMSALINGYEAERTPEDRVRDYYKDRMRSREDSIARYQAEAIKETVRLLGLEIEGINV